MARSVYFSNARQSEQLVTEDIICEAITIYGQDFFYIPRTLVGKDEILGEDRLSEFKSAYEIEMYLESHDGFEGQGAFIQKFGLMMEQSATLTVARRRWEQLIGKHAGVIPDRPLEGDLLYFPLTGGLFEIKFVKHQDPFYQLGKLFVYKLQVELFQYASEKIRTGYDAIDAFESLKTYDLSVTENGHVTEVYISYGGTGYASAPAITIGRSWAATTAYVVGDEICHNTRRYAVTVAGTSGATGPSHSSGLALNGTAEFKYLGLRATATCTVQDSKVYRATVTNEGSGYTSAPPIFFPANPGGGLATAVAIIDNSDDSMSFGDNNKFKKEAIGVVVFNSDNPFGDLDESIGNP